LSKLQFINPDHKKKIITQLKQPLFSNAAYLLGVDIVTALGGVIFWGLAARLYRAEDVGLANATISAVSLVSMIAGMGLATTLMRFLPEARFPIKFINTIYTTNIVSVLLVGGVYLVGLPLWSPSLTPLIHNHLEKIGFLIFAIVLILATLGRVTFLSRRKVAYFFIFTVTIQIIRVIFILIRSDWGVLGLVASIGFAFFLGVTLNISVFLPKILPGYKFRLHFNWSELIRLALYSTSDYISVLFYQSSILILPLMILGILGPASAGHAAIALMIGTLMLSPGLALAGSAFAEGVNSPASINIIQIKAGAPGLLLTALGALVVVLAAQWLLLFFGPDYAQEATGLLRLLALAAPFTVATSFYFSRLRVKKEMGRLILLSIILPVFILGVSAVLLPRIGLAASGIGWLLAHCFVTIIVVGRATRNYIVSGVVEV
jgi:O-antigen/teichoic acid export membrane protein